MANRLSKEMSGLSIGLCKYLQAAINGEVDRDDALADVEAFCERHGVWEKPGDAGLIDHACKDFCDDWRAYLDAKPEAEAKQEALDECRKNLKEATTKRDTAEAKVNTELGPAMNGPVRELERLLAAMAGREPTQGELEIRAALKEDIAAAKTALDPEMDKLKQASADVSRLFEAAAALESWLANHDNKRQRFEPD